MAVLGYILCSKRTVGEHWKQKYKKLLENKVLPGLEEYFDTRREPFAYSSYISNQPLSDRFYDDNVWLGIDFTDSYRMTKKQAYLEKAELIWEFILSGKDEVLGGGIYWCEQKKRVKNTCSNAPGAVFALKAISGNSRQHLFETRERVILNGLKRI